ncbi:hypothetical protein ACI2OX_09590 [Bacillus sp. N9]
MQKRFGIDIDGTVTCPTSLVPHINQAFQLDISLDDLIEYEITKCIDVSQDAFHKWFKQAEPEIYSTSPIAAGAKDVLSKWIDHHEIYFISARSDKLMNITENWFQQYEIDYNHIELIGSHDKVGTAQKHKIDLFFEDKHDNAVDIAEQLNIPVILFDTPYNRKPVPNNVIRVHHWQEAENWVNNWLVNS